MSSPIERYVRCSVTLGRWTVEPGIEWRAGDAFDTLASELEDVANGIAGYMAAMGDPLAASGATEDAFARRWPGRAYFVEIHNCHGRTLIAGVPALRVAAKLADSPDSV